MKIKEEYIFLIIGIIAMLFNFLQIENSVSAPISVLGISGFIIIKIFERMKQIHNE